MIKKAVLLTLTAPFLMVFSQFSYSQQLSSSDNIIWLHSTSDSALISSIESSSQCYWSSFASGGLRTKSGWFSDFNLPAVYYFRASKFNGIYSVRELHCPSSISHSAAFSGVADIDLSPIYGLQYSDAQCSESDGTTYATTSPAVASHLFSGGSVRTNGGACSVTIRGVNADCAPETNGNFYCSFDIVSTSTGEASSPSTGVQGGLAQSQIPSEDYPLPSALTALPGGCSDPANCVTIDDTSYLVDWDNVPEWFSYVGSDGVTYSKPQPDPTDPSDGSDGGGDVGGGCFTNCYPDDGSGGSDGGNDSGGSTGGGSSGGSGDDDSGNDSGGSTGGGSSGGGSTGGGSSGGGGSTGGGDSSGGGSSDGGGSGSGDGSTVPDFEFDESGIIEAVGSAGESNQDGLDAVSNDITKAIDEQTEATKGMFDGLGNTITNALGLGTCYPDDDAATSDKGLLGCIQNIANGMVNNFVDRLTNPDGMPSDADVEGMIDGEGTVDSLMESLDQGAEEQKETIYQEFEGTFESGGIIDGTLKPLRDFVTSFLPRIPNGGCTPLVFGTGPRSFTIDCEGFNLLKAALSWILFFFTAYQLIAIPMDARKTQ